MKHIIFTLLALGLMKIALAQSPELKTDVGTINGAAYKIIFPENWKGKLVMYAHGYSFSGSTDKQSANPRFVNSMKPYLDRGFAVAASDYSTNGWAFVEGVDDTEALRQYFFKKYGKPDTTFMVGTSMGGGIALATLENFGKFYNGGLPTCPLSSRPYLQNRKEFDLYVIFNALFPGVITPVTEIFDISKTRPAPSNTDMAARINEIKSAISRDSLQALAFAQHFDLKYNDIPISIFFNENVLRDVRDKAKGNPFDNTNTVYTGFANDFELNKKVERLAATVNPEAIYGKYDRTGNIDKPVVLVHTIYDPLIPPVFGVTNFENMVHHRGKDQYLTVRYTNGQRHCAFTPEQLGIAMDALRGWAKTGKKAKAGFIQ